MPIEQLLAMYGYGGGGGTTAGSQSSHSLSPNSQGQDSRSSSEEEILSNQVYSKLYIISMLVFCLSEVFVTHGFLISNFIHLLVYYVIVI